MHDHNYIGIIPNYNDFLLSIIKGDVDGYSFVRKFGFNSDIDTAADEDIWSVGGNYSFPSSASILRVDSTSASDVGTLGGKGVGAQVVTIQGLNADYNEVEVDVTLTGTVAVSTTQTFIRVNRAFVKEAGSNGTNVGDINIDLGGADRSQIPATYGQTQQTIYTVPAKKTAYLMDMSGAVVKRSSGIATLELWAHERGIKKMKQSINVSIDGSTTYQKDLRYIKIPETSDIRVHCSYASTNNLAVFANYGLILIDD